jgi:hypothetical protein
MNGDVIAPAGGVNSELAALLALRAPRLRAAARAVQTAVRREAAREETLEATDQGRQESQRVLADASCAGYGRPHAWRRAELRAVRG